MCAAYSVKLTDKSRASSVKEIPIIEINQIEINQIFFISKKKLNVF